MQKYSLDSFKAFGEAGYTPEEALSEIHGFYEQAAEKDRLSAYQEGLVKGFERAGPYDGWARAACWLVVLSFACGIPGFLIYRDVRMYDRWEAACKSGDAVGCLEGVQDMERPMKEGDARTNPATYPGRQNVATRYRIAYRLATGRDLTEH